MKKIIFTLLIFAFCQPVFSADTGTLDNILPQIPNIDNKVISIITFEPLTDAQNTINRNSENYLDGIQKATSRYTQTNVVAAYKDFSNIINSINGTNDFLYVNMAQRLNSLGFYTLSQSALINVEDTELWHKPVNALKMLYNPSVTLTYDEEIYLAHHLTATLYNNSAKETIKELENNDKILKKSDYANYILAVAYFENKNYSKAMSYINKAINKAPDCINYLHFKEKIYAQSGNYKAALKIINEINKKTYISNYYKDYLDNDKLFILIKTSKKDKAKYYSAKLLFQTGEYQKSLNEAQSAITLNKKNPDPYILIGDYYLKNKEFEKAKEYYQKAYNLKSKYSPTLIGFGHYYFVNKDYNTAYEFYLKAFKYSSSSQHEQILIYLANCLIAKNDMIHAEEYLKKAIKHNPNSDNAYYLLSRTNPNLQEQYLRTVISINPANNYAWLDLAEIKINQKKYKEAKEYLFTAQLIEPNNPKYTYLKNIIENQNKNALKSSYKKDNITEEFYKMLF